MATDIEKRVSGIKAGTRLRLRIVSLTYCANGAICAIRIVRTKRYSKDLRRLRLSEAEIAALEFAVANDPLSGDVIPGLEGLRKLRFAMGNRGKRGGGRAIYYLLLSDDVAIMITAYAKSEQADLSPDQKRAVLQMIRELKNG